MRWLRKDRSAWPGRWSRRAAAFPTTRGRSCRPPPWSRRAHISCRTTSCRYPHARLQCAFAGVYQIHNGKSFREGADGATAVYGGKVHTLVAFIAITREFMNLAIDGEASAGNISLDGLLGQIYPNLPDS